MDFTEIRRRTIVALFSDDVLYEQLVLKGGNAISLVYGYGSRASIDLDFSIENDFEDITDIERRIFAALEAKFGETGYTVFDRKFEAKPSQPRPESSPRWGGYQFEFKLIEKAKQAKLGGKLEDIRRNAVVIGPNQLRSFVVDLSKYERCHNKVEKAFDDYTIFVYTPEMIVIEKLRALCQQAESYKPNPHKRARSRDFYDIHLLVTQEDIKLTSEENLALLRDIFAAKEVPVELLKDLPAQYERNRLDWASVKDTVSGFLLEFDLYYQFTLNRAAEILKALGIE
jgi:predicted nucleotidyltransferase component of viral defense system